MNITLQLAREDFATNFCATLEHFLRWRDERDYRVTWNGPAGADAAVLYLHSRLGIAAPLWADPRRFAFVWRELRSGKSILESIARRLYLAAHLTPGPLRKRLAANRVTIEPRPARFDDGFYVPGGNQLRWFDTGSERCFVTLKRGFPEHFFLAQTSVRTNFEVPAPPLLEVDNEALIFVEGISRGIARVDASAAEKERLERLALAALTPLADASRQTTTVATYAREVLASIRAHADALPPTVATAVANAAAAISEQLSEAPLATVIAHGDMSFGHILEDEGGVVLIDWERSARRQEAHDRLVLALRPQLPGAFFEALAARTGGLGNELWLLVLESLEVATIESANPKIHEPTPGLTAFVAETSKLLRTRGMVAAS